MFGLQSVRGGPTYASRLGPFGRMFLRHAGVVQTAIAKNISMDVVRPSQLIDPSEDSDEDAEFEKNHRHYSFMAVLAMMSLFLLITISITGLLLGFCRKKGNSGTVGGRRRRRRGKGYNSGTLNDPRDNHHDNYGDDDDYTNSPQFELNDIDVDLETKSCGRDDPHGVCYYHLSDDDDDEDDCDDDDYDGEYEKANMAGGSASGGNSSVRRCKKERGGGSNRKRNRKWRRMLEGGGYYYHLYNNDDDDDYGGESWFEKDKGSSYHASSYDKDSARHRPPKRSRTFPQLHNVLTSCIRGSGRGRGSSNSNNNNNNGVENVQYQKLHPSPSTHNNDSQNIGAVENNINNGSPTSSTNASQHNATSMYSAASCSSLSSSSPLLPPSSSPSSHQHYDVHNNISTSSTSSNRGSGGKGGIRTRHAAHLKQRQARTHQPAHHPNHHLHQQSQRLRPRQMQHYSSLSYHRHTKLHHAIKHQPNAWPKHKRIPVVQPPGDSTTGGAAGGRRLLYKSHSIHAIPCSEPVERPTPKSQKSAGALEDSPHQCQVKVVVERVDYKADDDAGEELNCDLLARENV